MVTGWLEVAGLGLVLAGTFVKLFLTEVAMEARAERLHYDMALNVNRTLNVLIDHYRRTHHGQADADQIKAFDLATYQKGLEDVHLPSPRDANTFQTVDTYLFLLGSAMLIVAKLLPVLTSAASTT